MSNVPLEVWFVFVGMFLCGLGFGIAICTYQMIRDEQKRLRNKR